MKSIQAQKLLLMILMAGIFFAGCKKVELVRVAYVKTGTVTGIQPTFATANGTIVDLGEGGIKDHGFCWSETIMAPTKNDSVRSKGTSNSLGSYSSVLNGLSSNTSYYIRSYVEDDNGIVYGEVITFLTPTSGGGGYWLKYNDGINHTGIGLTDGSNFDYAIRFPVSSLTNYDGFRISKIRFFPKESAQYYVEVYEGVNPPSLVYYETVNNTTLNTWNEYSPANVYHIDHDKEVWVGIWVTNYFMGTYPAGVDDGPAQSGLGDMISFDGGVSWESLYAGNSALNYNWNLEVYITNQKGEQVQLANNPENFIKVTTPSVGMDVTRVVSEKDIK